MKKIIRKEKEKRCKREEKNTRALSGFNSRKTISLHRQQEDGDHLQTAAWQRFTKKPDVFNAPPQHAYEHTDTHAACYCVDVLLKPYSGNEHLRVGPALP